MAVIEEGGLRLDVSESHVPLLITAHLRTGVSIDPPYGLDIAGVLAARLRTLDRARLSDEGRLIGNPLPDTTEFDQGDMLLPVSRCLTGPEWHWLASCAVPVDPADSPEARTYYRVVDASWAHRAAQRPLPYVHPSKGPYRDMMMPSPVVVCPALQWQAVGDPEAVYRLLHGLRFIGRRRAVGEGGILRWEVEEVTTPAGRWGHIDHRGDEIIRPCPVECATSLEVDYRLGQYAIRPPSWHPDRLMEVAMTPEREEDWEW